MSKLYGLMHGIHQLVYLPNLVFLTVCAVLLTVVMGIRYAKTRKIMPAGIIAAIRFAQSSLLHKGTSLLCQVLIYICIQSPNVT